MWRQYELQVDLYKHNLDLVVKVNAGYYAITGAIVSYVLAHSGVTRIRFALLLPMVLSAGLLVLGGFSMAKLRGTRGELLDLRGGLKLRAVPEVRVLGIVIGIATVCQALVLLGLCVLFEVGVP
jgi:hypothetical protein